MRYDDAYGRRRQGRIGRRYGEDFRAGRVRAERRPRSGYGGDYWWLGEHELRRSHGLGPYDEAYRRFSAEHHPRYTPVGGMYHATGGSYAADRPPRPVREPQWMSEWTRWF